MGVRTREDIDTNYTHIVCVFIGELLKAPSLVSLMEPVLQPREINDKYAPPGLRLLYKTILSMVDRGVKTFTRDNILNEFQIATGRDSSKIERAIDQCLNEEADLEKPPDEAFFQQQWLRLRKYSALDTLARRGFDTSKYDCRLEDGNLEIAQAKSELLEQISIQQLMDMYEKDLTEVKSKYEEKSNTAIHANSGIAALVEQLKDTPDVGSSLCGYYLNSIIGGARRGTMFLRSAASNAGKAMPNYVEIPMFDGTWKKVGEVRPGDILIGSDGGPTEVLKIYPQAEMKTIYEVKLEDGRVAQCCEEHLWHVKIGGRTMTMSTKELSYYVQDSIAKAGPQCYLPIVQPVQYEAQQIPASSIDEIACKIKGGLWNVQLPSCFLYASIEQRRELYDKLTATDCHGRKYQIFTNQRLAKTYLQLCHGLGLAARCVYSAGTWRVDSWETTQLRIVSITNTHLVCDMTCFTVDTVDALFCMNDYIVTHNTRLSVFDACKLAYPLHWDQKQGEFILEKRVPQRVLYITTEMSTAEIQTICLAFVAGVEEQHIKRGVYEGDEEVRIHNAIKIMDAYQDYLILDSIPNPDLNNVRAMIKKHIIMEDVGYVFFDYIFTSPALLAQFSSNNIREDVALALLSNQLKEIATEFNVFVATSTQLNGDGLKPNEKRDQRALRGSKAIADKPDTACILAKVSPEELEMVRPYVTEFGAPTHVFDIYKLRSGTYKNHRVWSKIDLGTGRWKDLFVTNESNTFVQLDECTLLRREEEIVIHGGHWSQFSLEGLEVENSIYKGQ